MRQRRSFLRALAAGLGGAFCLSERLAAARPSAEGPAAGVPSTAEPGEAKPGEPEALAGDFGALVKKNFSGRG